MLRFLALTWDWRDPRACMAADAFRRALAGTGEWTVVCASKGFLAAHVTPPPAVSARDVRTIGVTGQPSGVVFGALFDRSNCPAAELDAGTGQTIASTAGAVLVESYWGSWVAILRTPTEALAVRAPGGALHCFHTRRDAVDIWCSDIEDVAALVTPVFTFDPGGVATALAHSDVVLNATGLEGVSELLGGQRFRTADGVLSRDWPWRPADAWFAERISDAEGAAGVLSGAVQNTTSAWASRYERILLRLSGGLDSSIVLGCLARAPNRPTVTALTYYIPPELFGSAAPASAVAARAGDERLYARLAAQAAGVRLLERERRPEGLALRVLAQSRRTARPSWLAFSPDLDRLDVEAVRETGAEAVFTGRGGDGMFFASTGPWAAIDEAWSGRLGPGIVPLMLEAGRMGRRSAWSILTLVIARGLMRRPFPPYPPSPAALGLLTTDAQRLIAQEASRYPWTALSDGLPPGKREQIDAFMLGHHYAEPFERGRVADVIDPLQSQPVLEAALRIPTAVLMEGGSRGLARRAFADLLPEEIRRRTSKGGGDPFIALVVNRNAPLMRELLMDGVLARLGLLDRAGVEAAFAMQATRGSVGAELLHAVGVEYWARSWSQNVVHGEA